MDIKSAKYFKTSYEDAPDKVSIQAVIDERNMSIPIDPNNRHYVAILEWAEKDGNEIQAAE
tara:strand:+ start:1729 stop:1911 length:183 start_codon:yes stop_codon:yes gene_type:complete